MTNRPDRSRYVGLLGLIGAALIVLCMPADAMPQLQGFAPDWRTTFFQTIATPDVAFVLLLAGIFGLVIEVGTPGVYFPGVAGAICLTLSLIAMSALPVQYGALTLLFLGIALMIGESVTPGIGALGIGGVIAFVTGATFLFEPGNASTAISIPVIAGSTIVCAGLTFFVVGAALKARHRPPATGPESMIGAGARVLEWSGQSGTVLMQGERWSARAATALKPQDCVRVIAREGLTLTVERDQRG